MCSPLAAGLSALDSALLWLDIPYTLHVQLRLSVSKNDRSAMILFLSHVDEYVRLSCLHYYVFL